MLQLIEYGWLLGQQTTTDLSMLLVYPRCLVIQLLLSCILTFYSQASSNDNDTVYTATEKMQQVHGALCIDYIQTPHELELAHCLAHCLIMM